jgi:hypothetical protein
MGSSSVGVSTYHLASGAFCAPFSGYASYYRPNSAIRIAVIYLCFHKHLHRKTVTHLFSETSSDIPFGRPLFSATFWLRLGQKKESLFFRPSEAARQARVPPENASFSLGSLEPESTSTKRYVGGWKGW